MSVSIRLAGVLATLFAISSATYQLGFPYTQNPYLPGYHHDFYHGANVYNPFIYSASQLHGLPQYNYYPSGHPTPYFKPHDFRGFAYHNDFNGGSTSNVLYLTGPGASPLGFYPGVESPAVEIARKKASDSLDKTVKKTEKIPQASVITKDLCDTIKGAFGSPGIHNIYSLDNGGFFGNPGFEYNLIPTAAPWPNVNQFLSPINPVDKSGGGSVKVDLPEDDDTVAIERKITVKVPSTSDAPTSVLNSDDSGKEDSTPGSEEEETRTIPPITPSSEPPTSQGSEETTTAEAARKRKSLRVRVAKKL